ncbi:GNAT family N-acetyltransferase [Salinibacterium sp. NK8237]|uniref:GNAT family N-acetyltransferase n=1 Tax=Salinibacterium sp. NK8237 TaxID=2792038 RepID=UPI0018CF098B|nr:GNAT family N-acetyltransferase [Salinibacterium sp. NK8237]MBH0131217.1 GNAT family N-acetyltransferase [Salinibacterium sp. NK8237]
MSTTYRVDTSLDRNAIIDLYAAVQWTAYTRDPERLVAAIAASLRVVTAWDGVRLVGLARIVGDGLTIVYLQDILVAPEYHRAGIGRELFLRAFQPYEDVRQKVLLTDDEPGQISFYRTMGFTEVRDLEQRTSVFTKFA